MKTEVLNAALNLIHHLTADAASLAATQSAGVVALPWKTLTPLTARVVRLLAESGWMSRDVIAERLGEAPEGKLTVLLPDLAERGVLESSTRKGYQLALPEDADPEAFRRLVLASLPADEPKVNGYALAHN